jgi:hypothetical protein
LSRTKKLKSLLPVLLEMIGLQEELQIAMDIRFNDEDIGQLGREELHCGYSPVPTSSSNTAILITLHGLSNPSLQMGRCTPF